MTPSPITVGPKAQLEEVREIFNNNNIHHVPVVDDGGRLVGIISITDYATALDSMTAFGNRQAEAANDQVLKAILAEDVMTREVATLHPDHHLETALAIFKENRFHCIPVVDKDKQLQGILTTYDIMIALINPADNAGFSITHSNTPGAGLEDLMDMEDDTDGTKHK